MHFEALLLFYLWYISIKLNDKTIFSSFFCIVLFGNIPTIAPYLTPLEILDLQYFMLSLKIFDFEPPTLNPMLIVSWAISHRW